MKFAVFSTTGNNIIPAWYDRATSKVHVFTCGGDGSVGSLANSGSGGSGGGGPGYARLDGVAWSPGQTVNLTLPAHGTAAATVIRDAGGNVIATIGGATNGTLRDVPGNAVAGGLGGGQIASSSGYTVLYQGGDGGDSDNGYGAGGGSPATPYGNGKTGGDVNQAGSGNNGTGGGGVPGPSATDGFNGNGGSNKGLGGTGPTGTAGGTVTTSGLVDGGDGSNGSGGSGGSDTINAGGAFTFPDDASNGGDGGYYTLWTDENGTAIRVRAGAGGGGGHQNTANGTDQGGDGGDGGGGGGGGGGGYNANGYTPVQSAGGIGTNSFVVIESGIFVPSTLSAGGGCRLNVGLGIGI